MSKAPTHAVVMAERARGLYTAAVLTAVVAGVFSLVVLALLVGNGRQMAQVNPFDGPIMARIKAMEAFHGNTPEVAEQFKPLDKALNERYAAALKYDKLGKGLLVVGVLIFLAGAETARQLRRRVPLPEGSSAPNPLDQLKGGRMALSIVGLMALGGFTFVVVKTPPNAAYAFDQKLKELTPPPPPPPAPPTVYLPGPKETVTVEKPVPYPVPVGGDAGIFAMQGLTPREILGTWPGFRGWWGDGTPVYAEPPMAWDGAAKKNIKWKTPIPLQGQGSPVVWVDKVFLSAAAKGKLMVYALDAGTGKQLWAAQAKVPGSVAVDPADLNEDTTLAAPSVATNGTCIVAVFGNGDVGAFDFAGKQLWGRSLGKPDMAYGYSSSPVVYGGNKAIIQFDTSDGGRLVCLALAEISLGKDAAGKEKKVKPGEALWDVKRDKQGPCWASPIIARAGGKAYIVTTGNPYVIAHEADTGKEAWRVEALSGDVAPSPIVAGGMVIAMQERAKIIALNLTTGKKVWERDDPTLPDTVSPAATDELLYTVSSMGTLTCFDLKTGKTVYEEELGEGCYSSPSVVDDKLYVTDRTGVTHIIAVGKTFKSLAKCPLGEPVDATPAFVGKRIYIRSKSSLFCIEG